MASEGSDERNPAWEQYGRALIRAMAEVTPELPEEYHGLILETADYWLSLGLAIGTQRRDEAIQLIEIIESDQAAQAELASDAQRFCADALS